MRGELVSLVSAYTLSVGSLLSGYCTSGIISSGQAMQLVHLVIPAIVVFGSSEAEAIQTTTHVYGRMARRRLI